MLDGLDAVVFYRWSFAVPPAWLLQNIASGLLGSRSFRGGWDTVALGVALQIFIAIGAAAFYYWASQVIPALYQKPWIFGPGFGIGLYYFMRWVVLPLSLVHKRTAPVTTLELIDQFFSHMFFVGLPIALMARRSARAG